jgi:hypothetical protein
VLLHFPAGSGSSFGELWGKMSDGGGLECGGTATLTGRYFQLRWWLGRGVVVNL